MSPLEELLKSASKDEIPVILDVIDIIYYLGRSQKYNGKLYTPKDLPSDEIYDQYRKTYTPNVKPGDHLSAKNDGIEKIKHEYAMGSLRKIHSDNFDIKEIENLGPYIETEKLDGVSMIATFIDGQLVRALTRYDTKYGRNILSKASRFVTRPDPAIAKGKLVVKGEVLFIGDSYKRMGMATPQNAVSGILGRTELSDLDKLAYVVFDLVYLDQYQSDSEVERLLKARELGFYIPRYQIVEKLDPNELADTFRKWKDTAHLGDSKKDTYAIDGIVVAPVNHPFENVETPRKKLAFKLQPEGVWTTVKRITARATRTGNVIPHIEIEPVEIDGITITFIAGSNYDILRSRKITVGSRVRVIRSMQTIPYIVEVDNSKIDYKPIEDPKFCPSCSTPLIKVGKFLKCPNQDCPERRLKVPVYFFRVLGLENFGEKLIESLNLMTIEDAYNFTVAALMNIEGFGEQRAKDFVQSIRTILKNVDGYKLLEAFGIPLIGDKNAILIVSDISLDKLFGVDLKSGELLEGWTFPHAQLHKITGIGENKIKSIEHFVPRAQSLIKFLVAQGLTVTKRKVVQCTLTGKTIALSGTGPHRRDWYVAEIQKCGGTISQSVSSHTDYLATDSPEANNKKIRDARKYNVPIISYATLESMLPK